MKLQPALIFGEHAVLQRDEPIPIWGRSTRNDTVTVTLNGVSRTAEAVNGEWAVVLPAMDAAKSVTLEIASAATDEAVVFKDIAIGEVWLAGGQSNMEFLLKYDEDAEEMYKDAADADLRFFRYPTANFVGCIEKDAYPDDGFWRSWTTVENRKMFSAVSAYMGRRLRGSLDVPIGFIGVTWGGTPAAAWTAMDDIESNPALSPVLTSYESSFEAVDLRKYYELSDKPTPEPTEEEQARTDKFMMGIGLEDIFKDGSPAPPPPSDYTPYMAGPRSAVRPSGLFDNILSKVAPYAVRGAVWYQGEDDDFRGRYSFYDESMTALIKSWRRLWNKELSFLQVELAPFKGRGPTGAKEYYTMRTKQRRVMDCVPGVHNVCIMDSGDEYNIHVRKKRPVGERLALLARKYVYGEERLLADSPRCSGAVRNGSSVSILFDFAGDGLELRGDIESVLSITVDGMAVTADARVCGNELILSSDSFACGGKIEILFCEQNYCVDPLFNSVGLPAFPFTVEV